MTNYIKVSATAGNITKTMFAKFKILHVVLLLLSMKTVLFLHNSILNGLLESSSPQDDSSPETNLLINEINEDPSPETNLLTNEINEDPSPETNFLINEINEENVKYLKGINLNTGDHLTKALENNDLNAAVEYMRGLPQLTNPSTGKPLRYLSLGCTAPRQDGEIFMHDASYTSLLSSNLQDVVRAACGNSGPIYPSTCTQSVISNAIKTPVEYRNGDEEEFDVIIINYFAKGNNGVYDLARRLRQRYPDAIMVLLRVCQINHINLFRDSKMIGTLKDWAKGNRVMYGSEEFLRKLGRSSENLKWRDFTSRDDVLLKIEQDFGGFVVDNGDGSGTGSPSMGPVKIRGVQMSIDPKETLEKYHHLYSNDYKSLSVAGHLQLYSAIREAVEEGLQTYPAQPRIGTWGDGDACFSWYTSGAFPTSGYKHDLIMEHFQPAPQNDLYALSTGRRNINGWGWLLVVNPFNEPRNLFLSYMASGPAPSIYPKTEITVFSEDGGGAIDAHDPISKVVLDPVSSEFGSEGVHTVLTTNVGVIPPGPAKVVWHPLEERKRPFRITAMGIVGLDTKIGGVLGPAVDYKLASY